MVVGVYKVNHHPKTDMVDGKVRDQELFAAVNGGSYNLLVYI